MILKHAIHGVLPYTCLFSSSDFFICTQRVWSYSQSYYTSCSESNSGFCVSYHRSSYLSQCSLLIVLFLLIMLSSLDSHLSKSCSWPHTNNGSPHNQPILTLWIKPRWPRIRRFRRLSVFFSSSVCVSACAFRVSHRILSNLHGSRSAFRRKADRFLPRSRRFFNERLIFWKESEQTQC